MSVSAVTLPYPPEVVVKTPPVAAKFLLPMSPPKVREVTVVLRPAEVVPAILLEVSNGTFCNARLLPKLRVPAEMAAVPVKRLVPERTKVPAPALVRPAVPEIGAVIVRMRAAVLTVITGEEPELLRVNTELLLCCRITSVVVELWVMFPIVLAVLILMVVPLAKPVPKVAVKPAPSAGVLLVQFPTPPQMAEAPPPVQV